MSVLNETYGKVIKAFMPIILLLGFVSSRINGSV
jgi:hypothetical protein